MTTFPNGLDDVAPWTSFAADGTETDPAALSQLARCLRHPSADGTETDPAALSQLARCLRHPSAVAGALMADHHKGYSMPIGGVVAYRDQLSPSGVGFDIGCGNSAALTNLREEDIRPDLPRLMDEVASRIEFGVGGRYHHVRDHAVLQDDAWELAPWWVRSLHARASNQLGTVGGGNHYVNIMADEEGRVWVTTHFGSRGLGHTIATGYLNLASGKDDPHARYQDDMDAPPVLLPVASELGQEYALTCGLAADYALAGRQIVSDQVVYAILHGHVVNQVNVHHNDYWREEVDGDLAYVVRKGATPLRPGELAYIGGSMTDGAAIVEGVGVTHTMVANPAGEVARYSAPHGAGRIMSRSQAKGNRKGTRPGRVTHKMMAEAVAEAGVELRGGDLDESPFVYRKLDPVLAVHPNLRVVHRLRTLGCAMAPSRTMDPYKD